MINCLQFEGLGFCREGEAPNFIRNNTFTIEGSLPFNTSGGQLSVGQAGAAGGFLGLVQAMRQVTGQARKTQVAGAARARKRLRHDQLRPRSLHRCRDPGARLGTCHDRRPQAPAPPQPDPSVAAADAAARQRSRAALR